jgi:hypothetical protein
MVPNHQADHVVSNEGYCPHDIPIKYPMISLRISPWIFPSPPRRPGPDDPEASEWNLGMTKMLQS